MRFILMKIHTLYAWIIFDRIEINLLTVNAGQSNIIYTVKIKENI